MLNPGKCKPKRPDDIKDNPQKFSTIDGKLNRDPTQGKIANVIKPAYDNKPWGYVFIVNLCEKRGTNPEELLMCDFGENPKARVIKEIEDKLKEQKNQIQWIWVAFGNKSYGKDKTQIDKLKHDVMEYLEKLFENKLIGKIIDYMHPGQKFHREEKQSMISQIQEKVKSSLIKMSK